MARSKRAVRLLVVLGALVVLIGAYVVVKSVPKPKAKSNYTSIKIASIKKADITKVDIKKGDSTVVLNRHGKDFSPVTPYPMRIDSSAVSQVILNLTDLYAQRVVQKKASTDLAKYGLHASDKVITVSLKQGQPIVLTIGGKTPDNGGYYVQKQGDPKVYSVDSYSVGEMLVNLTNLRDKSLPSINQKKLVYFDLFNGKRNIVIEPAPSDYKTDEAMISSFLMTKPYKRVHPVATDKFDSFFKKLPSFSIDTFVDDHPKNLAKYGLAPAKRELELRDDKNTLDLLFGNDAPGGGRYVKLADSPGVFTISGDMSFLDTTAFDLVDKFALIINIDKVAKLRLVTPNKTYTATLTTTGTGKDKKSTYTFEGKKANDKFFKNFYQKAIGILYDAENPSPHPGKPEVSISYTLSGSNKTLTVDFVPFNSNFYQVYRDGISQFVVSRSQISQLIQAAQTLAKGKNPGNS